MRGPESVDPAWSPRFIQAHPDYFHSLIRKGGESSIGAALSAFTAYSRTNSELSSVPFDNIVLINCEY